MTCRYYASTWRWQSTLKIQDTVTRHGKSSLGVSTFYHEQLVELILNPGVRPLQSMQARRFLRLSEAENANDGNI
jgi:hypothetical protein